MTRWGIICPTFIVGSNRLTDLVQSGLITCIRFCRRHQPSRLAWKAFHWRGIKYLRTLEALTGFQCHGRSFKVWRYAPAGDKGGYYYSLGVVEKQSKEAC